MPRTDFSRMGCPIARSMEVLGERWAILVMREAFYGTTRFDDFARHLGIASNILSARLAKLVEHGMLERVPEGARHAYRLTEKGRDFFPAFLALKRWSDRWMAPNGPVVRVVDRVTGEEVSSPPPLGGDGVPLVPESVRLLPGPGAGEAMRRRLALKEMADG
ncbi:helix-turn-helix transcriptional regulator [Roseomonas sp. SSH11]|uniref:Helix-turn-helix transcriptional regulator n=1 Tax=Pararoseomonas baculiformis TaxID=2820812 RepID=A0ABS4AJ83_9PROT|nr:helix-turn-helix domain-containing protein [Pararoseomonas baculiformis]MBP0447092.1 helix-turn-helix transcriptional regulator [Pararoseomonas baculiformis]